MAVRVKLSNRSNASVKPIMLAPTVRNRFPGPGAYRYKVDFAKYKDAGDLFVLFGTPYISDENDVVTEYEKIYLNIRRWKYNDEEVGPLEIFADVYDLDAANVEAEMFVGKDFAVYIDIYERNSNIFIGTDFAE